MCKVKAKEKRQKMEENKMRKMDKTVGVVRERDRLPSEYKKRRNK